MTSGRKLRLGVAGLGRAFMLMRPAFTASPLIELVAAADPRPEARRQFVAEFRGKSYEDIGDLLRDPAVEAIYIATPHQFHAAQTVAAAAAGKHILVEKPMALNLADADAMVDAAKQARVALIVGPSHSFDAPIAATRRLVTSGEFGALKMITALNFTDFLFRPRRPEELDTAQGGGVVFNQAAHQIDIVRLLAGGLGESVFAHCLAWDASRPTEGAYTALLRFPGDVVASLTYSGYAHFDSDEFMDWIAESGRPKDRDAFARARRARSPHLTTAGERELRRQRGYGATAPNSAAETSPAAHEHFGFLVASCEHADLRPTPGGVAIYSDQGYELRQLPPPTVPRGEVIEELRAAVLESEAPLHSGEWGRATLEACLGILQSSRERRAVELRRQVALPENR